MVMQNQVSGLQPAGDEYNDLLNGWRKRVEELEEEIASLQETIEEQSDHVIEITAERIFYETEAAAAKKVAENLQVEILKMRMAAVKSGTEYHAEIDADVSAGLTS